MRKSFNCLDTLAARQLFSMFIITIFLLRIQHVLIYTYICDVCVAVVLILDWELLSRKNSSSSIKLFLTQASAFGM